MSTFDKLISLLKKGESSSALSCRLCHQPAKLLEQSSECIICNASACDNCCKFHCHIEKLSYGKVCDDCVCNIVMNEDKVFTFRHGITNTSSWRYDDFLPSRDHSVYMNLKELALSFRDGFVSTTNPQSCYFSVQISCGLKCLFRSSIIACEVIDSKIRWDDSVDLLVDIRNPWSRHLIFDFHLWSPTSIPTTTASSNRHERFRLPIHSFFKQQSHVKPIQDHMIRGPVTINAQSDEPIVVDFELRVVHIGREVESSIPSLFSISIPGAIPWTLVEPNLSNRHKIALSLLFETKSAVFSSLFSCLCDSSHLPQNNPLSIGNSSFYNGDALVVSLRIANSMKTTAFSHGNDNKVASSSSSNAMQMMRLETSLPHLLVPSNEIVIHGIDYVKLSISFVLDNINQTVNHPLGNRFAETGTLLLTTHRLLYLVNCKDDRHVHVQSFPLFQIKQASIGRQHKQKDCYPGYLHITDQQDGIAYGFMHCKERVRTNLSAATLPIDEILSCRSIRFIYDEILWRKVEDRFSSASIEDISRISSIYPHLILNQELAYALETEYKRYELAN
jgi:hypothetical protein